MNKNISKLIKLNNLASLYFRRKHIIVLDPTEKHENIEELNSDIVYDKVDWKIPEKIRQTIDELSQNSQLSDEDKILTIFERVCKEYVYDDNLISYIQKIDDDSYDLPDWYGRDVGQEWEEKRDEHNRRVCYEVSRYLAKSLMELFKNNDDIDVCILWDKGHTHYFVGLTSSKYNITLDTDDFNNIKDFTRIKAGLTAQGIVILEDNNREFEYALDRFNEHRSKEAIKSIESQMSNNIATSSVSEKEENFDSTNTFENILFLQNAIEILKGKYNIDSQGLFEYMKEIVDIRLGPESRKKIWKRLNKDSAKSIRYIRCLLLDIDGQKHILDVDKMLLREFDEEELKSEDSDFVHYRELSRDWEEPYDGS